MLKGHINNYGIAQYRTCGQNGRQKTAQAEFNRRDKICMVIDDRCVK